eukprot:10257841-Prorocentrum_lima.AAC.1
MLHVPSASMRKTPTTCGHGVTPRLPSRSTSTRCARSCGGWWIKPVARNMPRSGAHLALCAWLSDAAAAGT